MHISISTALIYAMLPGTQPSFKALRYSPDTSERQNKSSYDSISAMWTPETIFHGPQPL